MKVALVGQGRVGSTLAYTLLVRGLADEMVLVDRDADRALGEALDLQHAEAFIGHPVKIRAGGIAETAGSDIVILCCSAPWSAAYTSRFDLGRPNLALFRELVPPLAKASPGAKVLVVTNPVDVMTYHALELTGFGPERVFGTGTLIDSARFRTLLSGSMGIHPDDVRAYVLGEHGDTQFPIFRSAVAGGSRLIGEEAAHETLREVGRAGFEVVRLKGHTNYAISMAAALVVEAVAWNTCRTMPLSVRIDGIHGVRDACLSLPVVVGSRGIARVLEPDLDGGEVEAFRRCAAVMREGLARSLQAG